MQANNVLQPSHEATATITKGNMISIPVAVQRALKVHPGKKITFHIIGESVSVTPEPFTIDTLAGSIIPLRAIDDIEAVIREAKTEHVDYLLDKLAHEA